MSPEELCRLLVTGPVAAASVPELADEEIRAEVEERLAQVGCGLAYSPSADAFMARLDGTLPQVEDHHPVLSLHAAELAVLAACWLHLRFLPEERGRIEVGDDDSLLAAGDDPPSLEVDDLLTQFHGKLNRGYVENIVLGRLKNADFLRQHDRRLFPGPMLDTIEPVAAAHHARLLVARHQRLAYLERRAGELLGEDDDRGGS